ncbi:MAG TPA: RICIN domain-containing protein, partial [Rugosimonospora sp.]|nr:RICIN domain-containing protein [Rugosimonospora sp.]
AWPAFWMLGADIGSVGWPARGEIDIMENIGQEPEVVHGSMHGPGYSGGNPLSAAYDLGQPVSAGYHTYTVDREPDAVTFYVDGHEYERRTPNDTNGNPWVFNQPFFLILNLAVGGNWPGSPDAGTAFPMQMVIDYVHVNALVDGADQTPTAQPPASASGGGAAPGPSPSGGQGAGGVPAAAPIVGYGDKCVDVRSARRRNGTRVQLFTCNNTAAQQWTAVGLTLQALGKCLDVSGAGTRDGTRVQLWDCNGTVAQDWQDSGGQLINPHSGKCLDATGPSSSDGTPLQIWTCHGGPNQKWRLTTTVPTPGPTATPAPPPSDAPPAGPASTSASPYLYLGWGSPPDPRTVMSATGIRSFTLAFMLSGGGCQPAWDGQRPLSGGGDAQAIDDIRAAGGDVVVSFGGASGPSLEQVCGSAGELANAYRTVIDAYQLKAIDIDIEGSVYGDPNAQQRTVDALKQVKAGRPQVAVYVTIPADRGGPDSSMIDRAARSGLAVDAWTIMPFDFGAAGQDMAALTAQSADGLARVLSSAYGYTSAQAYQHAGISSMNGITDAGETVTVATMQSILAYAQLHHIARLSFWSTNRDRPCDGAYRNDDSCSGVDQAAWDFTRTVARYTG